MEILMMQPSLSKKIWGGRKLIEDYGFETKEENIGEAWVLSCHKDGLSVVTGGKYDGLTLNEVIKAEGKEILGTNNADKEGFPILIKLIDAADRLSIQVHPGDEYAWENEHENGKTEAWYVLSADEGSELLYGVDEELTPQEFAQSIKDDSLVEKLRHVKVKRGDVVFIPSGMIHAIGSGILLAEVQQSSNTTYRIYDYGRLENGKPRDLHIKQASDVSTLSPVKVDFSPEGKEEKKEDAIVTYLTGCEYFKMTSVKLDGQYTDFADGESFVFLLTLEGNAVLSGGGRTFELKKGSGTFIPASFGEFTVEGKAEILRARA